MRAVVFRGIGHVAVESVADAKVQDPGDAVVRVLRTAICGSDLHAFHGREVGLDPGTVLGHEFLGEVESVGSAVQNFGPGDLVVAPFSTACGACWACAAGLSARCSRGALFGWVQDGHGLHGAQAERVRVPLADTTLWRVPAEVSLDAALLLGDVVVTGAYAARRADIGPESTCAVVGCGPVGLSAIWAARAAGATSIFAFDTVAERRALATRFGAHAIDPGLAPGDEDAGAAIREATDGRGADAVIEAVGAPSSMRLAFGLLRSGGTLSIAGVHTDATFAFSPGGLYDKNATVRSGRCPARSLMPALAPWLVAHASDVSSLITHRFPLEDAVAAWHLFDARRGGCIKVVLDPTM